MNDMTALAKLFLVFWLSLLALAACGSATELGGDTGDASDVNDAADGAIDEPVDPPDEDASSCAAPMISSTLPGVSYDLSRNRCQFGLDEASAGITFLFRTVVEGDLSGVAVEPLDWGGCGDTVDVSGLLTFVEIGGNGERYCRCDVGLCDSPIPPPRRVVDLAAGSYDAELLWNGRNWIGPSDYSNPYGPPFPPGTYTFSLRAVGVYQSSDGVETPYEVTGSLEFRLVP